MIIPSIDLMNGKAVQLRQGKEKVLERDDPVELARQFSRFGEIAVIDLDAALGTGDNEELIRELCSIAECRVGGGIRSIEKAKKMVSYGASKIIIGTKAFENDNVNHAFLQKMAKTIGNERLMIAIDAMNWEIVTQGWKHPTGLRLFDVVPVLEEYANGYLFTCVEKEGQLEGTDLDTLRELRTHTVHRITIAGGVKSLEEIRKISALGADVQIGMALYTDRIKLEDAFIECLNWKNDLIPTIACDPSGQVLMLAYSNRESLKTMFDTGNACYYSRSRGQLWLKGKVSGNLQEFVSIRTDCDRDALLLTVKQEGVACHLKSYSCFGDRRFSLDELYDVIKERLDNPRPGSYTAALTNVVVREKIMEEAQEVVEAEKREEIIWEAADVLYFLTALLAKSDIALTEVLNELRRRRR